MTLTALTLTEKDAVRRFFASQEGLTHSEIVDYVQLKFNKRIGRSTVGKILSSKPESDITPTRFRHRASNFPEVEHMLLAFVQDQPEGVALSAEVLLTQARTVRPVSMSWVQRFKKRYGFTRKLLTAGPSSAPDELHPRPPQANEGDGEAPAALPAELHLEAKGVAAETPTAAASGDLNTSAERPPQKRPRGRPSKAQAALSLAASIVTASAQPGEGGRAGVPVAPALETCGRSANASGTTQASPASSGAASSLAPPSTDINALLNSEESSVTQAAPQRTSVAPVNANAAETSGSTNSSPDVNTLLLTRILQALEEQSEATRAQTRSNQELLAFLRQRAT